MSNQVVADFTYAPTISSFMADDSPVRIIIGPVGSGKTYGCCIEIMRRALQQEPSPVDNIRYFKAAVVRNTMPQLKRTTMETWLSVFPEERTGELRRTSPIAHKIKISPNEETGEPGLDLQVDFFALDTENDARSLLSYEGTMIWFNEAREIPKKIIDNATERVGRYPSMAKGGVMPTWYGVIGDTNPPDEDHWFYKFHMLDPQAGYSFYQQPSGVLEMKVMDDGSYRSVDPEFPEHVVAADKADDYIVRSADKYWATNPDAENLPNLPVAEKGADPLSSLGYYLNLVSGKDYDHIRGYYQGRYGPVFDGKPVIPGFNRTLMVDKSLEPLAGASLVLGVDIGGGTLSPACVVGQRHQSGIWMILAELSPPGDGIGLETFVDELKYLLADVFPKNEAGRVYCDPAGADRDPLFARTMFSHLQSKGFNASPAPNNDPRDRIESIKAPMGRMKDGKCGLLVHPRCKMLIRGLLGGWRYKRVQVAGDERYMNIPTKNQYSHVCDALGYLLQSAGEGQELRRGGRPKQRGGGQGKMQTDPLR